MLHGHDRPGPNEHLIQETEVLLLAGLAHVAIIAFTVSRLSCICRLCRSLLPYLQIPGFSIAST